MEDSSRIVDLLQKLQVERGNGPLWSLASSDLNVNLLHFSEGRGVPLHRNDEVDVLIVVLAGDGELEIDGETSHLQPGQACVVPKGCTRAIRSGGQSLSYLTCHRRRPGLSPV